MQLPKLFREGHLKGHAQPRVAMVGRSNVGKSSLINALMGGRLAQVSKEPGKTCKIHFYLWKDVGKIIADLPGYGYARKAATEREYWAKLVQAYLNADERLERALVLLDARHPPSPLDIEAIRFLSLEQVPVTLVFTKADALKNQSERVARRREASRILTDLGYDPELAFWVSSRTKDGLKELTRELREK